MATIKLNIEKTISSIVGQETPFPKYTTQIINLANQNAQGTRPKVVGQLSEMIKEIPEKSYSGWKSWYKKTHGARINVAVDKIETMVGNLKDAIKLIDREMIRRWVEDLMYEKTAEGLILQELILKYLSERLKVKYRLATPEEESKNVDGFIGGTAVQIKPSTFDSKKPTVRGEITASLIIYEVKGKNLFIHTDLL